MHTPGLAQAAMRLTHVVRGLILSRAGSLARHLPASVQDCACARLQLFQKMQQHSGMLMLADLRFVKWVPSTHLQFVKEGVVKLINSAKTELVAVLSGRLQPEESVDDLRATLDSHLDIFRSLRTEKQELGVLKDYMGCNPETSSWLAPTKRPLVDPTGEKSGDFVYDFPVDALLKRLINNSPQVYMPHA